MKRPSVTLVSSAIECRRMLENEQAYYQGWSNEATWEFNLYFLQERNNYEELCNLICKRGSNGFLHDSVYRDIARLMRVVYDSGRMEPLEEGALYNVVNVREIVDTLFGELKREKTKCG